MKKTKFYDTSSLLLEDCKNLSLNHFVISSITLEELEGIKTSKHKGYEIKEQAKNITRFLFKNRDKYSVHIFQPKMLKPLKHFEVTNDIKILATAINYQKQQDIVFYTNDLALNNIAQQYLDTDYIIPKAKPLYTGVKKISATDEELSYFYSNLNKNTYNLLIGQYLLIYDKNHKLVDSLCWTGETHRTLIYSDFSSKHLGKIKPKDELQALVADSFYNNQLTIVTGPAGSGKSLIALGYLFKQLEKNWIDKIIIFCNTVAAKNSARLGFLPGDRLEKLLDSQIGNFLTSKLGSRIEVERLIKEEKLMLLPMSDIRGFDTSGANAGIYITESQNLDIYLMKLALQRIGEDSICIIEGDNLAQVDLQDYEGSNNGMNRASEIFRGQEFFGQVQLKNIYRSEIASIAEKM